MSNKDQQKCTHKWHKFYPMYGAAPHTHDLSNGSFIGSTKKLPKDKWPDTFIEDPEEPGLGTYLCPGCKNQN